MLEAVRRLSVAPGVPGVNLYKNNTDGKGASYGTHENYLMRRETPFADIVRHLDAVLRRPPGHLRGRAGRHRPGLHQRRASRSPSAPTSSRSRSGLETTLKRPIINTRDEPHAVADLYRRLHVIIGDANQCDVANLLKLGTTSLVLAMIEDRAITEDLAVSKPVATLHAVSHDPTLQTLIELRDGRTMTAVQLLWVYHEHADRYLQSRYAGELDADTAEVMQRWADVLTRLERDPMECARELDWVAKLQLLQGYRDRDGLEWSDHRLRAIDIQWSDVRPEKGLYHRLLSLGRIEQLVSDEDVKSAVVTPPEDTRAYFRGPLPGEVPRRDRGRVVGLGDLRRAGARVAAAGADARAAARHPGARRRAAGPQPRRHHAVAGVGGGNRLRSRCD